MVDTATLVGLAVRTGVSASGGGFVASRAAGELAERGFREARARGLFEEAVADSPINQSGPAESFLGGLL